MLLIRTTVISIQIRLDTVLYLNSVQGKNMYICILALKGMFLYVIIACISIRVVTMTCKQFCDCLTQNINESGMDYLLSCVTCVENWHEKNTGMSQIIYICL